MTKSRIFKKLNLRRKADRNFRGKFLKNCFRHLKFYSNPPSWMARSRCYMSVFWKTKGWNSHFWEGQPFKFRYVEVHHPKRLNLRKQVFLLNLRLWPAQKPKIWSIFYGKKVCMRKFCSVKARGFWFKNYYFSSSACCSYPCHRSCRIYYSLSRWHVTSEA